MNMRETIEWALATLPEECTSGVAAYKAYVRGPQVLRIGMSSDQAIIHRIGCGCGATEAAAKEYLYRWNLALRSPVFGCPHTLGL